MPLATQIKLLRVLESGEITRVGSNEPIKVNVRILSATNRDLEDAIARRHVPQDLYHRLKVRHGRRCRGWRERTQDIPLLIEHFLKQFAKRHHKKIKSMSTAARRRLMAYDWPGNVRQLRNAIESMVVVDFDGCSTSTTCRRSWPAPARAAAAPTAGGGSRDLVGQPLTEIERLFIAETLKLTGGNREEAAEMLGIGERTLYRKIKEYGLN